MDLDRRKASGNCIDHKQLFVRVKKHLGDFDLDIEFDAKPGITVLFGYSGAGKSLTLKTIAGLASPDEGQIALGSQVLFDSRRKIELSPQKRTLGCVFQDLALFPHMTVSENIAFGAPKTWNKEQVGDRLDELVPMLNLIGHVNKRTHEISGGQQQRVALARAIMRKPNALLLDEPFNALDNPLRAEMRTCLRNVMSSLSIPVLLVTHDIVEAYEMADEIAVFSNGRVAQFGKPTDVFGNPNCVDVARLVDMERFAPSSHQVAWAQVSRAWCN